MGKTLPLILGSGCIIAAAYASALSPAPRPNNRPPQESTRQEQPLPVMMTSDVYETLDEISARCPEIQEARKALELAIATNDRECFARELITIQQMASSAKNLKPYLRKDSTLEVLIAAVSAEKGDFSSALDYLHSAYEKQPKFSTAKQGLIIAITKAHEIIQDAAQLEKQKKYSEARARVGDAALTLERILPMVFEQNIAMDDKKLFPGIKEVSHPPRDPRVPQEVLKHNSLLQVLYNRDIISLKIMVRTYYGEDNLFLASILQEEVLKQEPSIQDIYDAGVLYGKRKMFTEAEGHFLRALEQLGKEKSNAAKVFARGHDPDQGYDFSYSPLSMDPAIVWNDLSYCYEQQGKMDAAEHALMNAIDIETRIKSQETRNSSQLYRSHMNLARIYLKSPEMTEKLASPSPYLLPALLTFFDPVRFSVRTEYLLQEKINCTNAVLIGDLLNRQRASPHALRAYLLAYSQGCPTQQEILASMSLLDQKFYSNLPIAQIVENELLKMGLEKEHAMTLALAFQ